ncbi:MAG: c-type cytochrome biogenesis protein CcmI [Hyphomicrobiales bacterium]
MWLWIAFAVLTALALAAVLKPLLRAASASRPDEDSPELAIYRDQLSEVERDVERGVVGSDEAEAARTEISRRLLAADEAAQKAKTSATNPQPVAGMVIAGVVAVSLAGYLTWGSPDLPGQPRKERIQNAAANQNFQALIVQVEQQLEKNPEDARGWQVLAPAYMRVRRYADAADAFAKAVDLTPSPGADLLTAWGEASVLARSGLVTAEANSAFLRALSVDPKYPKARYFAGIAAAQDGRNEEAIKIWTELLADAPADAPWRQTVVGQINKLQGVDTEAPGPDREDIEAAQQMSAEDRAQMIQSMVTRLSERLQEDGKDLNGWMRLVRARMVLKQKQEAIKALSDARANFAGDEASLAQLDSLASQMGLE